MKRTEAINFIEKLLIDLEEKCPNSSTNEKAQMILSELEYRMGMLPPADYLNPNEQVGRSLPFYSNEWEPEND